MKTIIVKTNQNVLEAEVLKENPLTVWVKLPDGNVIKRHKVKHVVNQNAQ